LIIPATEGTVKTFGLNPIPNQLPNGVQHQVNAGKTAAVTGY
jgi:hypothetical protein